MNPCVISRAILSRIQADTGTGGLFSASGGTAYNIITAANFNLGAPQSFTAPWMVWDINLIHDNTMPGMQANFDITFYANDDSANANANLELVIDRLIGDSMLSTGTRAVPTYGFHNHRLALPSNTMNATASEMTMVSARIAPDDPRYLVATAIFKGIVSNLAVNP